MKPNVSRKPATRRRRGARADREVRAQLHVAVHGPHSSAGNGSDRIRGRGSQDTEDATQNHTPDDLGQCRGDDHSYWGNAPKIKHHGTTHECANCARGCAKYELALTAQPTYDETGRNGKCSLAQNLRSSKP